MSRAVRDSAALVLNPRSELFDGVGDGDGAMHDEPGRGEEDFGGEATRGVFVDAVRDEVPELGRELVHLRDLRRGAQTLRAMLNPPHVLSSARALLRGKEPFSPATTTRRDATC